MERFAAHGNVFFVEAVGQILEVLELGAEALEFDVELVEAFISLLGTCFKLGVVLVFDFVELGLELFLEVLNVLVILLTLGLDDVFDVLFHFVSMLGDFHPLFLTIFDFGVVALELLLV